MSGHWHTLQSLGRNYPIVNNTLVILGSGYTANFVLPLAESRYTHVLATSRDPARHLSQVPPNRRIRFDLMRRETWKNIPSDADLLWCFPAEPVDLVQECASYLNVASRRLVVLGSTSAYLANVGNEYPPPWTDESAVIDTNKSRVQGEEFLRTHCKAIILRVAGIYGPDRNPIEWIRTGRVSPSRKYVNLIHVYDLARICLAALDRAKPGEAYNVSDGIPRPWSAICEMARDRWAISLSPEHAKAPPGKRITNRKLVDELGLSLLHADLFTELDGL